MTELVFIGLLILASVLDAGARKRRRRRRVEEMERDEGSESGTSPRRRPPSAGQGPRGEAVGRRAGTEVLDRGERETADSMIPTDLWEVLTGQTHPEASAEPEELPVPEAGPRWEEARPPLEDPAPFSVREAEPRPVPEAAPPRPPPEPIRPRMERAPASSSEPSARVLWALESAPEHARAVLARPAVAISRSEDSRASRYTSLLRQGRSESARAAIVLREVLGPPAGLRGVGGGWEER